MSYIYIFFSNLGLYMLLEYDFPKDKMTKIQNSKFICRKILFSTSKMRGTAQGIS